MAHRMLQEQDTPKSKVVYKSVDKYIDRIKSRIPLFMDSCVLLTISFLYFFFTGIAVMLGKPIPKQWMDIATKLTKEKIAKKIIQEAPQPSGNSIKVVDLETKQPIPLTP